MATASSARADEHWRVDALTVSAADEATDRADPAPRRRRHTARLVRLVILPVTVLAIWQAAAMLELYNTVLLPPPSRVFMAAIGLIASGELLRHFADSMRRIALANLVSIATAVPLGVLMGRYRPFEEIMDGLLNILRPIPPLAWIPLAILWFGLGESSVVFITLISAFFAILINTIAGVRSVDRSLIRAALTLGASQHDLIKDVVLPATLPHIITGVRIALGVSWMSIVAAELIASSSGLGYMISYYREVLRSDLILVGMLTIGLIGFVMDRGLLWLERRLLPWCTRVEP
ncbi:MAG TPA: ABC transporter permease [Candidatus Sulfotelmatobacter sp.]|nr:ABC transporter permease [Candidatus Sulfotelmatobacter sp.]